MKRPLDPKVAEAVILDLLSDGRELTDDQFFGEVGGVFYDALRRLEAAGKVQLTEMPCAEFKVKKATP